MTGDGENPAKYPSPGTEHREGRLRVCQVDLILQREYRFDRILTFQVRRSCLVGHAPIPDYECTLHFTRIEMRAGPPTGEPARTQSVSS